MDVRRLDEANRVFSELLELPIEQRQARCAELCAADPLLRALVQRLLASASEPEPTGTEDVRQGAVWRNALAQLVDTPTLAEGAALGAHRLIRRLGYGGSAEVYLGERRQDGVVQLVAIKLMLAEAIDAVSLARFRQEQQILARLSHPNIGKIYDIGLSSAGRPYFVMEYVDGEPIDQYCDRRGLDLRQRLQLFLLVADAAAHAHAELVVHRDIKPSNVLVDARGEPKLVDFGIAKIIGADHSDTELTMPGAAPITVGYASPEQLNGETVGVASDIYQLGMLAYVLLVGQRPHGVRGMSRDEVAAVTVLMARTPPSGKLRQLLKHGEQARVATIAAQRRMKVSTLLRGLSGDLDRVVLKAIAHRPADRYASVPQLADDVRNVLSGHPISARPPSMVYVLSKMVRQHPLLSAAFALVMFGLMVFSIAITVLAFRLDEARQRAEHQSQLASQVTDFLVTTFRAAEPEYGGDEGSIVKRALDNAADAPPTRYVDDPGFNAQLHLVLGRAYDMLYEHELSRREYERALESARALPSGDRFLPENQALNALGRSALFDSKPDEALRYFHQVIAATAGAASSRQLHFAAMANASAAHSALGDDDAALAANAAAIEGFRSLYGPSHPQTIRIQSSRLQKLTADGRYAPPDHLAEAAALSAPLLEHAELSLGAEDAETLIIRQMHFRIMAYRNELEAAVAGLRATLPAIERVFGKSDLHDLNARRELGVALAKLGKHDEAIAEIEQVLAGFRHRFGKRHPDLRRTRFAQSIVLALAGHDDAAIAALEADADIDLLDREPALAHLLNDPRVVAMRQR